MIFKCENHTTWDTWAYYNNGIYYVYYLITDYSSGEGYGVATSNDGVHFVDQGTCITASDDMVVYLGTGAVWKSPFFEKDKQFICNYSEWRKDETGSNVQNIFFAKSKNLIDWVKVGEDKVFKIDEEKYIKYEHDGGRWDCIFPYIEDGKYYGYFTATPKDYLGCGFADSKDGVTWIAGKPPRFCVEDKGITHGVEVGAVHKYGDKYYMLMGTYDHPQGVSVLVSDTLNGDYYPQKKNFSLFSNHTYMHSYFMRMFQAGDRLLVNHHCLTGCYNEHGRVITLLAPFKVVNFDEEGILRLKWFENNELLKGEKQKVLTNTSFYAEGVVDKELCIELLENTPVTISIDKSNGHVVISKDGQTKEDICKDVKLETGNFILLCRDRCIELYINDWYVTSYTLDGHVTNITADNNQNVTFYTLNI